MVTKDELRDRFSIQRDNLGYPDVAQASHAVSDKLQGSYDWSKATRVLSYAPINNELDPTLFESRLKRDHPDVVIEHVIPTRDAPAPEGQFDVIFVPCLAVDKSKNRLGNGGGWYDKFLATQNGVTIGLAYEFSVIEKLPTEDHDRKLSIVVTV